MGDLLYLLESILGNSTKQTGNEYYFHCPFCNHRKPKLAVNITKTAWHCWVCGESGASCFTLFKKLKCTRSEFNKLQDIVSNDLSISRSIANDVETEDTHELPSEYLPLWKPDTSFEYRAALRYVLARGLTKYDIVKYGVGFCKTGRYGGRIIVPSYTAQGKLNYYVARAFHIHTSIPYLLPPFSKNIICFESYINWNEPLVLCEGVFDAISIKFNAIPLLGKFVPMQLMEKIYIEAPPMVVVMLDSDASTQAIKIASTMYKNNIPVKLIQMIEKDPGSMSSLDILSLIERTPPLSFSSLIKHTTVNS